MIELILRVTGKVDDAAQDELEQLVEKLFKPLRNLFFDRHGDDDGEDVFYVRKWVDGDPNTRPILHKCNCILYEIVGDEPMVKLGEELVSYRNKECIYCEDEDNE